MEFNINLTVQDTLCTAELEQRIPIPTGCRGEFRVVLHADTSWDGMDKTVVFRAGQVSKSQHIGSGTSCLVPPEVLTERVNYLEIGVYGTAGEDVVRTTTWARLYGIVPGALPSYEALESPDLYAQLLAQLNATVKTVNGQAPDADGNVNVEGGGTETPGGYYTPSVTQPDNNTMRVSYTASQEGMEAVPDVDLTLPEGPTGATPNIQIGTVTTLEPGSAATASMGGTAENPELNLCIPQGQPGAAGKSAYEYAQEGGYTGTEEEFTAKLSEFPTGLPAMSADTAGQYLTNDGTAAKWVTIINGEEVSY